MYIIRFERNAKDGLKTKIVMIEMILSLGLGETLLELEVSWQKSCRPFSYYDGEGRMAALTELQNVALCG